MASQQTLYISLWIKVPYTVFVCVLVPVYWIQYGPANLLSGSDIALLVTLLAIWTANRLLASMMALAVLLSELAWNVDFLSRLLVGSEAVPLAGTQYMFDTDIPLFVRALSLFHVALPVILIWLMYHLGYDRKAIYFQTLLAWIVLPITYAFTEPAKNINLVFGFGHEPQTAMPGLLYLGLLMLLFPLFIYLPLHVLLNRVFGGLTSMQAKRATTGNEQR